ncbi:MAG TPA: type II toxin-antitoxin system RelE/ParE family toxin [Thermomicrobiales bacterium]|nr:type II toxin-antitoxin system RelE/ParE family toxin [Thermomicrobiales bacterium]
MALAGNEPVREWLRSLSIDDKKAIGTDLMTVEMGWPIGMPTCRAIEGQRGMWEVRTNLPGGRISRVLFVISDSRMVLLHGFIKETQKPPQGEIQTALQRRKRVGE